MSNNVTTEAKLAEFIRANPGRVSVSWTPAEIEAARLFVQRVRGIIQEDQQNAALPLPAPGQQTSPL